MRPIPVAGAGVIAAAATLAYATLVEPRARRLRRVTVPDALAPGTPRPLRVLHLSDLHVSLPDAGLSRFVGRLATLDADLVVVTGDLLGGTGAEDTAADLLGPLTASGTPGLVVLGSNDRYGPTPRNPLRYLAGPTNAHPTGARLDTDRLVATLGRNRFRVLVNERALVDTGVGRIAVAALDDPHLPGTRLPPAADLVPEVADPVLALGLVHAPYAAALDLLHDAGCRLLLAGHTHGGQLRVPGVGALVTNCDLPRAQARGLSRWREGWLHVSAGLGTSRYAPFRFACPPEASLLRLLPAG